MSDIQAAPADDQPAQETPVADAPAADVAVTAAPADAGNAPASDVSEAAPSTTVSASTASDTTTEAAATATDAPPAADAPPVTITTAPTPVIDDRQMATAAASLEALSSLYNGMDFAMRALRQISSLGTAVTERQAALDALNQQIAQAQMELSALQGDVSRQSDAANSVVSNAVAHATKLRGDADAYVAEVRAQAAKDATLVRQGALAECDAMRAAADQHVSNAHVEVRTAREDVSGIHALKAVLAGELADLETKVAVGRASLRQLLGEA